MFYEIKEDIRQQLNKDDIIDVLMALGSNYPREGKDCLVFQTVCHHHPEDNMRYKLYYYYESGVFMCYTGSQDSYDVYGLVQDTLAYRGIRLSLEESIEYVVNHSTITIGFGVSPTQGIGGKYT